MANKDLFKSTTGKHVPAATTVNEAGGLAYEFGPEHSLAQLAATGTFNDTFYGTASDQIEIISQVASKVSDEFLAKTAVYAREKGCMKDMPAALLVLLSIRDPKLFDKVFDRIVDSTKMVRNFVQITRSGALGRKSLGSGPKRLIKRWLARQSARYLLNATGQNPSLADVIKMVHPRPATEERRHLYAYLIGREYDESKLPEVVQEFERFKRGESLEVPNVDFRKLTGSELSKEQWAAIADKAGWDELRQNLNTYTRHGVFDVPGMTEKVAAILGDPEVVRKQRVFPYQLLAAYLNTGPARKNLYWARNFREEDDFVPAPQAVRNALQDAVEVATENMAAFGQKVHIIVDTSGSMQSPVTGHRKGATTKVTCVDVAALFASVIARKNPGSTITPVDTRVHATDDINPRDSIMTNSAKLAAYGGGGTELSLALAHLNQKNETGQLIIVFSDNESWVDSTGRQRWRGTAFMEEFRKYEARNPGAKMVCVDMQPNTSGQAPDAPGSILNIGGFSESMFETIQRFVNSKGYGKLEEAAKPEVNWVEEIKAINL